MNFNKFSVLKKLLHTFDFEVIIGILYFVANNRTLKFPFWVFLHKLLVNELLIS